MDADAILAYLSDGRRLGNDNVRELARAPDQVRMSVSAIPLYLMPHLDYLRLQQVLPRRRPGGRTAGVVARTAPATFRTGYVVSPRL